MKQCNSKIVVITLATIILLQLVACGRQSEEALAQKRIKESTLIGQQFMSALQGKLQSSIENEGLAAAIAVCKSESVALEQLYREQNPHLANLRRVSLKPRNVALHTPTEPEAKILQQMQQNLQNKQPVKPLYMSEVQTVMLPILVANAVCLNCHGAAETFAPELKEQLSVHYPQDSATGYSMGQMRGALAITFK